MKVERINGLNTKRLLIETAEQLFTEKGIENVTLVDVSKSSGQKNRNAAQYHFGDRMGLISAVLDKHDQLISQKRQSLLSRLEAKGEFSLLQLVQTIVLPIVEHIKNHPNGLTYVHLMCQLLNSRESLTYGKKRMKNSDETWRAHELMIAKMEPHTQEILDLKQILIQSILFNGLANFYDIRPAGSTKKFVDTLCNAMVAMLLDPTND